MRKASLNLMYRWTGRTINILHQHKCKIKGRSNQIWQNLVFWVANLFWLVSFPEITLRSLCIHLDALILDFCIETVCPAMSDPTSITVQYCSGEDSFCHMVDHQCHARLISVHLLSVLLCRTWSNWPEWDHLIKHVYHFSGQVLLTYYQQRTGSSCLKQHSLKLLKICLKLSHFFSYHYWSSSS